MGGWVTIWVLQAMLMMASCAPSREDGVLGERNSLDGQSGLPAKEDELMDGGFPGSGTDRDLIQIPEKDLDAKGGNDERFSIEDLDFGGEVQERYIGFCKVAHILMWPGNSRKFWSYGCVYLKEPYLANCTMIYYYNTRSTPDPFCKYGFRVTGWFHGLGPTDYDDDCINTDYVFLNDSNGNEAYYCGTNATIDWMTIESDFEFHFITKEDSPRAKGFYVIIQSFKLCGGSYNIDEDGPSGNLHTPHFPARNYPPNLACTWYFQADNMEGHEVSVKIVCASFNIQDPYNNGTEYCLDAVIVNHEAGYPSESRIFCSNTLDNENHVIYSTHNSLLISFRTDSAIEDAGFNCTYEFILFGE